METDNKSVFNAGVGQAQEVRELQNIINRARLNPLAVMSSDMSPNYKVAFSCITSCWLEVKPKSTTSEIESVEKVKSMIEEYIKFFPPVTNSGQINNKNLNRIIKLMEIYEGKVRACLEHHELNSPSKPDVRRSVAQMN